MMTETQISPEKHEAAHTAIKVEMRNGERVYVLYGMIEVSDLATACELLIDRRQTPRHVPEPVLQRRPLLYREEVVAPVGRGSLAKFPWE